MKRDAAKRLKGLVKLATPVVFLVLLSACGGDETPTPRPTLGPTVAPAATATPRPMPTTEPAATATPIPQPTAIPTVEPTPSPTPDPAIGIKAEVEAAVRQFGQALNTADADLLASLFLQTEKTTRISHAVPLRMNGWAAVEESFKGYLGLPPGGVSLVPRQGRTDLLGDGAAIWTGHFILSIRPPEESPRTVEGRMTVVFQKVDGEWLRVAMHSSVLPQ